MREHNLSCGYCYGRSTCKIAIFDSSTEILSKEGGTDNRPCIVKAGATGSDFQSHLLSCMMTTVGHEFHDVFQKGPFRMLPGHDLTLHILDAQHFCSRHWDGHHAQSSHREPQAGNWNPGKEIHSLCLDG